MANAIAIMNEEVKGLVEEVYGRAMARHNMKSIFKAIPVEEVSASWVVSATRQFEEANPLGIQLINNILDESTYNDSYQLIGEKSKADMEEIEWEVFMLTGFAKDEKGFGKKLVYLNTVGAIIQRICEFEEVSMTVHADVMVEEEEKMKNVADEINSGMERTIGIIVELIYTHSLNPLYLDLPEEEFVPMFQDKAMEVEQNTPESIAVEQAVEKVMDLEHTAKLFAQVAKVKVAKREVNPLELLLNHRKVFSDILADFVTMSIVVFYHMRKETDVYTYDKMTETMNTVLETEPLVE